jgi:hypothetical protein
MYGFEKRQSTADWRLVALMTKRGSSGRSWSVRSPKRCFLYEAATFSPTEPGVTIPRKIPEKSIVSPARRLSGPTTRSTNWGAGPAAKSRSGHATASCPAAIEPPETLETRSSRESQPASFRRQSEPAWKSIAR